MAVDPIESMTNRNDKEAKIKARKQADDPERADTAATLTTSADLGELSKGDLYELTQKLEVSRRSKISRKELVRAILPRQMGPKTKPARRTAKTKAIRPDAMARKLGISRGAAGDARDGVDMPQSSVRGHHGDRPHRTQLPMRRDCAALHLAISRKRPGWLRIRWLLRWRDWWRCNPWRSPSTTQRALGWAWCRTPSPTTQRLARQAGPIREQCGA